MWLLSKDFNLEVRGDREEKKTKQVKGVSVDKHMCIFVWRAVHFLAVVFEDPCRPLPQRSPEHLSQFCRAPPAWLYGALMEGSS